MATRDRNPTLLYGIATMLVLAAAGCQGTLDAGPTVPDGVVVPLESGPGTLRVLTVRQYVASVRAVLELPADIAVPAIGNWTSSFGAAHNPAGAIADYEAASHEIAALAFANETVRGGILDGCVPTTAAGDACTVRVISTIGRRAFRRELGVAEMQRWTETAAALSETLGDPYLALQYTVAGLLQSPNFVYRVELPELTTGPDGDGYYGSDALASRLSYFLWDSTPDDALLDAAARGDLLDPAGYDAQVERMLADPRVEGGVEAFVYDLFYVSWLEGRCTGDDCDELLPAPPAYAPQLLATATTAALEGGFREMLLTRSPFVNEETADLYGLDPADFGTQLERVQLPATSGRVGALLTPGHSSRTSVLGRPSVVRRGLFVLRDMLCASIGGPPAEADEIIRNTPPPTMPTTARERAEIHARPQCASCHERIDPIGLGLEQYDGLGQFRELEEGLPIDPSGELEGDAFDDAEGLVEVIASRPDFLRCMTTQLYTRATGEPVDVDAQQIRAVTSAGEGDVRRTMGEIARLQAFRHAHAHAVEGEMP